MSFCRNMNVASDDKQLKCIIKWSSELVEGAALCHRIVHKNLSVRSKSNRWKNKHERNKRVTVSSPHQLNSD